MKVEEYLKIHRKKYDLSPQDEIKLLFQAHFGGGHFVPDNGRAEEYIKEELNLINENEYSDYPLTEKVSDEYFRLHLIKAKDSGISTKTIATLFTLSAKCFSDTFEFENDVKNLIDPIFSKEYLCGGVRPISHSGEYRKKYSPHYRVISNKYLNYMPLFCKIDDLLKTKQKIVIGIDGKAGAGKTTLAKILFEVYGASIINADDFFTPFEIKDQARSEEIGGNIDYVRMKKEVFEKLSENEITYRPFSCKKQSLLTPKKVDTRNITVIEGSYSSHPYFDYKYDISVFCDVDEKTQKERIVLRNGEFSKRYFEEFIPKENAFFEKYKTKEKADIVIK